ncbi:MAG: CHASE2 domain-containing protein [Coleofasciculus sp. G1-WW12-02]|uniref:CHASE2 domain-containing protein n=1 Tax=Coleofasciculus sp. G1-WW12-02 TaxID=3068483 RepID=UPI0032FB1DF4
MTPNRFVFYLKVQRVEQACLFELSWGRGQQIGVTVPYPETLTTLYQEWSTVYLSFYKQALRGRVSQMGNLNTPPIDWHAKLVQAEAKLLYEFHQWLRRGELFELRSRIVQVVRDQGMKDIPIIEIFLTCNPLELARLPWEAWEIGTEFAAPSQIHILRTPLTIQGTTVTPRRRRRARVLVIWGDDTGLDFKADQEAVRSLTGIAEVVFVSWQPGQDGNALKTEIVKQITDERGWDILFFTGHSNETILTGGEFAIAPGVSVNFSEIATPVKIAKERGLQFALFNSCNGLSLANSLIDLGLSQVAVMREPIHNQVAQEFLVQFLQRLAQFHDVQESLREACQYLKLEKHLTYPSAYLVPSLFRHPDAPPFCLEPRGWKQQVKGWLPTKLEAIALLVLMFLSLRPGVQDFLLERRVWMQSVYRNITAQTPTDKSPPVLLVHIDRDSLIHANIDARRINPIDRTYLARLIDQLTALDAKVIGLDYLLDSPTDEDEVLAQSIQHAIDKKQTWLVFAAVKTGNEELGIIDSLAHPNWSLEAYINAPLWYAKLLPAHTSCADSCSFAYLLALARAANQTPIDPNLPQPQRLTETDSSAIFRTRLVSYLDQNPAPNPLTAFLHELRLPSITNPSRNFQQLWLYPIIDFSIPPDYAYQTIAAWELLENTNNAPTPEQLKQQVVLIAAGGYDQAGVTDGGSDNFPIPLAVDYWRSQNPQLNYPPVFTGGEAHAYTMHHLLSQRLVIPIPDLWMVGMAAFLGKGMVLIISERRQIKIWHWLVLLTSATAIYGLIGLQVYISAALLVPLFLPSVTIGIYALYIVARRY